MLVLSRKRQQVVVIELPDDRKVTLVVIDIRGDKVRLGIDAPLDINVVRQELLERDQNEVK